MRACLICLQYHVWFHYTLQLVICILFVELEQPLSFLSINFFLERVHSVLQITNYLSVSLLEYKRAL